MCLVCGGNICAGTGMCQQVVYSGWSYVQYFSLAAVSLVVFKVKSIKTKVMSWFYRE